MVALPVPDQIDPLVPRILRPHVFQILQPVRRMLRPIDPTEQPLVKHVQRKQVVDRPELPVVLGRDSPGALAREPPLSFVRDQLDRTDLVGREDDRRVVAFPSELVDLPFLLLEERVGGGLPGADRLMEDLDLAGNYPQPLLTDGRDQSPLNRWLAEAAEGPLGIGESEVAEATEGEVDQRLALLVGELRRTPRTPLGPKHRHPVLVEGADHAANVALVGQGDERDSREGFPW